MQKKTATKTSSTENPYDKRLIVAIKSFLTEHTLFPVQFIFCGVDLITELAHHGISREDIGRKRQVEKEEEDEI
jgi:hypothetical protein